MKRTQAFSTLMFLLLLANCADVTASPSSSPPKISEGIYWVGETDMGLRIKGGRYQLYDAGGEGQWKSISELKYVKNGVVFDGKTYWCLSTLPEPRNIRAVCSANGWAPTRTQAR
jgi:hypothetical protein